MVGANEMQMSNDSTEHDDTKNQSNNVVEQGLIERLKTLTCDQDITEEFFKAAKELERGEIEIHSSYTLSDAVSAIEIMDPKMDSGMEKPDTTLGLENALKNGKLKQKLSVTELLATVDCTVAALASWLNDAQALDQTVFTNIWLHDLSQISDPVHLALSKAVVCLVQMLRSVVNMAACYSEEDFVSAFTFEHQSAPFAEVEKQLRIAEELVAARVKAKQNKQENSALLNRIRFYQQTLVVFDSLIPLNDKHTATDARKRQPQIGAGRAALKSVLSHLQSARETVKLGKQPPNGVDGNYSWLNCFQPKVNQHLLPPTFPRDVRFMTRVDGYDFLLNMFHSILNMADEMPEANCILSLDTLMDYLERYSYTDVITRSFSQMILLPVDDCLLGTRPMIDLVMNSIDEFSLTIQQDKLQQYISSVSSELSTQYDEFMTDAVRAYLSVIQLFGHNRMRFHDKYVPELIDIFSALRTTAIALETNLRDVLASTDIHQCFSTFSDFYATRLAILYMDLSFQLNLFVDYELPYVFWAYSDVLYRRIYGYCRSRNQNVVCSVNYQRPNTADYVKAQARERYAKNSLYRTLVYQDFATGCFLLFSALADDKKIKVPPQEENRFWRRMLPCVQMFADEELSYDRYWNYFLYAREHDDPPMKMRDWEVPTRYAIAIEYFKRAEVTMTRNYVANEQLVRAIKSNLIALNMLLKRLDTGKKIRVEYLQGPLFPTVSIK